MHTAHAPPPEPHAPLVLPGWHAPTVSRQPLHAPPEHTPEALQVSPLMQVWQLTPLRPQAPSMLPAWQPPSVPMQPVQPGSRHTLEQIWLPTQV